MRNPSRLEDWGRILFDQLHGELVAEVCRIAEPLSVTKPVAMACWLGGQGWMAPPWSRASTDLTLQSPVSVDDWREILRRVRSWGVLFLCLHGADSLSPADLQFLLDEADRLGLGYALALDEEAPEFCRFLHKGTWLHLRLDVHRAERTDLPISKLSLFKMMELVQSCLADDLRVRIVTRWDPLALDELYELAEALAAAGIEDWMITPMDGDVKAAEKLDRELWRMVTSSSWLRAPRQRDPADRETSLFVRPDGCLCARSPGSRSPSILGQLLQLELAEISSPSRFDLASHVEQWIDLRMSCQDPACSRCSADPEGSPNGTRAAAGKDKDYEVFFSYATDDRDAVHRIALDLEARGIRPWLFDWDSVPGDSWQHALQAIIEKLPVGVVFLGSRGVGGFQDEEIQMLTDVKKRVIPVFLKGYEGLAPPVFLRNRTWIDFRVENPDPLERLMIGIRAAPETPASP